MIEDTTSEDDVDSEEEDEEEKWSPKKAVKLRKPVKEKFPKGKTGRALRTAILSQEDKASLTEEAIVDSRIHISLESASETITNIEDPSDRSTIRSEHNTSLSSLSWRPVLRQRRNGHKVVQSSDESGVEDEEEANKKNSFTASVSGLEDAQEHTILESLHKLSIGSDTEDYRLRDVLALCQQDSACDFTSFIDTHQITSAPAIRTKTRGKRAAAAPVPNVFRKIGEASYSEVFGVWSESGTAEPSKVVMKVVPLDMNPTKTVSARSGKSNNSEEDDEICLTKVEDIAKEIEITRLMNGVHEGFVKLHEYVIPVAQQTCSLS